MDYLQARQEAEDYQQAAINEQEMFNTLYNEIGTYVGNPPEEQAPPKPIEPQLKDYIGKERVVNNTTVYDQYNNPIVIPAGFKIAADSGTNVTEGIVIEDDDVIEGIGNGRGNQYVWIPVSNIDGKGTNKIKKGNEEIEITLGRYTFGDNGKEKLEQTAENYANETVIDQYYSELKVYRDGVANLNVGTNRTAKDLKGFIDSVGANGGYYIARYEASYGKDNKPNSKVSNNPNDTDTAPTTEGYLWNNITQIDAAKACENMYSTISSDLVNSYAYDTAIVYIQNFSNNQNYSRTNTINKNLSNTGTIKDEVCKINDMASNCHEWTTENCTRTGTREGTEESYNYTCTVRGGGCKYPDSNFSANRGSDPANAYYKQYTFRPILYIDTPAS